MVFDLHNLSVHCISLILMIHSDIAIADALTFADERGVAHHDVKSGNILIDASKGGKLLLADFGNSVKPGKENTGFTRSYAISELLASYELDDYSDLR